MEPTPQEPEARNEGKEPRKSNLNAISWVLGGMLAAGALLGVKHMQTHSKPKPNPPAAAAPAPATPAGPETLFLQHGDAVVRIINPSTGAVGTGVFIPMKNWTAILTESRITEEAPAILVVKEPTGKNPKPQAWISETILRSKEEGIALLRLREVNSTPKPPSLQNAGNLSPGSKVLVLGYPNGKNIALQEAMVATSTIALITLSNQTFLEGGGMPVFTPDGKVIAITMQTGAAIHAVPVSRLQKTQWEKETGQIDSDQMESLHGLAASWARLDEGFDAQISTHLQTFGKRAVEIRDSFQRLGTAVAKLKAAERAVSWNQLGEKGETEKKIREVIGFINAGKELSTAAANCVAAEQPAVSQRTLDSTALAQTAIDLGDAATRLVALTQNNTADETLKTELAEKAKAYFQQKKTHEKSWENP